MKGDKSKHVEAADIMTPKISPTVKRKLKTKDIERARHYSQNNNYTIREFVKTLAAKILIDTLQAAIFR